MTKIRFGLAGLCFSAAWMTGCVDESVLDVLEPEVRGTIRGTVTVQDEGVSGILVEYSGPSSGTSLTGSSGGFLFEDLDLGTYSIEISEFDTLSMVFENISFSVELTRAEPSASVPFSGRLPFPGGITVNVVDTNTGSGVEGAKVTITGATIDTTAFTSDAGLFSLTEAPIGEYQIQVLLPLGFEASGEMERTLTVSENSISSAEFTSIRLEVVSDTIQPGTTDTLSIGTGAVLVVEAEIGALPVRVVFESAEKEEVDWGGYDVTGEPIELLLETQVEAAPAQSPVESAGGMGLITLYLPAETESTTADVVAAISLGGDAYIKLTVEAEATSFVDPITGKERTTSLVHIPYPTEEGTIRAYFSRRRKLASCTVREVTPYDGSEDPEGRTPLILVHGWQRGLTDCDAFQEFDAEEHWSEFTEYWESSAVSETVRESYALYFVTYPTYESIAGNSAWLAAKLDSLDLTEAVILGHSMGGLIGRGVLLSLEELLDLRGLITLGTPHEGSPLAKYTEDQLLSKEVRAVCHFFGTGTADRIAGWLPGTLLKETDGFRDLSPESSFISTIKDRHEDGPRIFTLGSTVGGLNPGPVAPTTFEPAPWDPLVEAMKLEMQRHLGCAMQALEEKVIPSDGIVPLSSALPSWTAGQLDLPDILHTVLAEDQRVFSEVIGALEAMRTCTPPPPPLEANDFNFSASLARVDDRMVDVTINPIVIGGEVVTGLTKANFTVIENGCGRDFDLTTSEGDVGVDIAFAQDMSGSMGTEIRGVRESVISFAQILRAQGLNVQFASIGYSGNGTIPSTPGPSPKEFLGPVQTQSSAEAFQSHVASKWTATGGGDGPENGLEAIEWLHGNLPWRSGAARVYIDITDASHHTKDTNCNGAGACTDQDLSSISAMLSGSGTIHVVASEYESSRTYGGGLDPWKLADATGGVKRTLGSGYFDLTTLGISEVLLETARLSFMSSSIGPAVNHLRIRITVGDKVAELAPGAVFYVPPVDPSLVRGGI